MISFKSVDYKLFTLISIALVAECWILFSDFHFFGKPLNSKNTTIQVAQIKSVVGSVKVRTPFQLNWQKITAGVPLFEGDEIMTGDKSKVSFAFIDGHFVSLGSNSVIALKKMRFLNRRAFTLNLLQGSVQQEVSDKASEDGQLEIQVGSQKVVSSGVASFTIENTGSGKATIDVNSGNVAVTDAAEKSVDLQNPSRSGFGFLKMPVLNKPIQDAVIELLGTEQKPLLLKWDAEKGIAGVDRVEVATDPFFEKIIVQKEFSSSDGSSWEFSPMKEGLFYWRVIRKMERQELTSSPFRFRIFRKIAAPLLKRPKVVKTNVILPSKMDAPKLKRPVIHYPTQNLGAKINGFLDQIFSALSSLGVSTCLASLKDDGVTTGQSKAKQYTVELEWVPVLGAHAYQIQVSTDSEFKHLVIETSVEQPKYTWATEIAGFYYWRVAGISEGGERGPFSEFMTFAIQAERNLLGDEATYETYLQFDEYSKRQHALRFYLGPEYNNYYFSSSNPASPSSVIERTVTYSQFQVQYDYLINTHYSASFMINANKNYIDPQDFENHARRQDYLVSHETQLYLSIERRFFQPSFYLSVWTGLAASYIDQPVKSAQSGVFSLSKFPYFGPFVLAGVHKKFLDFYWAGLEVGGLYQSTGDSFRIAQMGRFEVKRSLNNTLNLGVWLQQQWTAYRFDAESLSGSGHSLAFWPMLFLELTF